MTRSQLAWTVALGLVAAAWIGSWLVYPALPSTVPVHWNLAGKVDGYGPKGSTAFLMPVFMIALLGLFRALPFLSPKNFEVDSFHLTYLFIMIVVLAMFAFIHGVIMLATWQAVNKVAHPIDIGRAIFAGMFLGLTLMGSVMGKVRRNFYIGVRTPWTLASDRVWNDTHRLAALSMVAGNLLGFVVTLLGFSLLWAFTLLFVSLGVPLVYSFVHYKKLENQGAL